MTNKKHWRKDNLARHVMEPHPHELPRAYSFTDLYRTFSLADLELHHAEMHGGVAHNPDGSLREATA